MEDFCECTLLSLKLDSTVWLFFLYHQRTHCMSSWLVGAAQFLDIVTQWYSSISFVKLYLGLPSSSGKSESLCPLLIQISFSSSKLFLTFLEISRSHQLNRPIETWFALVHPKVYMNLALEQKVF